MHRLKRIITAVAVSVGLLATGLAVAAPASANNVYGDCFSNGAVCLYYTSSYNGYGASLVQGGDIPDYNGYTFSCGRYGCNGAGQGVRNNAAAVDSDISATFTVFYGAWYDCSYACQVIGAYGSVNLDGTLSNNNASGKAGSF